MSIFTVGHIEFSNMAISISTTVNKYPIQIPCGKKTRKRVSICNSTTFS